MATITSNPVSNIIESDDDKGGAVERKGRKKTARSNFEKIIKEKNKNKIKVKHVPQSRGR